MIRTGATTDCRRRSFHPKKLSLAVSNVGHIPELPENGHIALQQLKAGGFELMFLDIETPVMDGFEVPWQMKTDEILADVRTLVISSVDEIGSIAKAIELGAVDIHPKYFDLIIFRARINACLERSQSKRRDNRAISQIQRQTR